MNTFCICIGPTSMVCLESRGGQPAAVLFFWLRTLQVRTQNFSEGGGRERLFSFHGTVAEKTFSLEISNFSAKKHLM